MEFRKWWRQNRKKWPQKQIAEVLNVTSGAVQRWIQGERTPRDADMAKLTEISEGDVCVLDFFPLSATALEEADRKRAEQQGKSDESELKTVGSAVPVQRNAGKVQG